MKIFWRAIVGIVTFVFAVSLVIQLPQVQTTIANKVVNSISDKIQGDITFEKVHFKPFTTFVLKNVLIIDKHPVCDTVTNTQVDTFFQSQYIIAKFSLEGLFNRDKLILDKVFISDAQMNLVLEDPCQNLKEGVEPKGGESLTRIFGIDKYKEKKKKNDKDIFLIKKVEFNNFNYSMNNHRSRKTPIRGTIDWNDLDVTILNLNVIDLGFKGGVMSGKVDELSIKEKNGWFIKNISGDVKVGNGMTAIDNLKILDEWSDVNIRRFTMSYDNPREFVDFNNNIRLNAKVLPSTLDFRTLQYFSFNLADNRINANISGAMDGYVNDFVVKDVNLAVKGGGFSGKVNGRLTNIPEIDKATIDVSLSNFLVTSDGVGNFISEWMKEGELDLSGYAKGILFSLNGQAKGSINNLWTDISLTSLVGRAYATLNIGHIIDSQNPINFKGTVSTQNLDAGVLINNNLINHTSINAGFDIKFGRTMTVPDITLDSLTVERLGFNGYEYTDITANGFFNSEKFDASIISNDPNLSFLVNASKTQIDSISNFTIVADIARADLNAINVDNRGRSEVSFYSSAEFSISQDDRINGQAEINGLILENEDQIFKIGDISLSSTQGKEGYNLNLTAPFAEATYYGTASPKHFVEDFKGIVLQRELPAIFTDTSYSWSGDTYKVNLMFHDMMDVLAFAMPGVYIEVGTSLDTEINDNGEFKAGIKSGRLAYKKQYFKGLSAEFDNLNNNVTGSITSDEIQISAIKFNDTRLGVFLKDNHIGAGFTYNNDTDIENHGQLVLHSKLNRSQAGLDLNVDVAPSSIFIDSKEWSVLPSNINILGHTISVDSFGLVSGDESIKVSGRTSDTQNDTLTLELQRFDISMLNSLMPEIGIKGAISGIADLTSGFQKKILNINMICDSTYITNTPLGVLNISGIWDNEKSSIDMRVFNDLSGRNTIDALSHINLGEKTMHTRFDMNKFRIRYAQPLLSSVFSQMDGYISGDIMLDGEFDSLDISSVDCRLEDAELTVDYTDVPYFADGTFHLDNQGVYFDQINICDRYDGTGNIYGSIYWNNFKDINFDTSIRVNNIEGINISETKGDVFYGNVFATGNVSITGPSNEVALNIDAITSKPGEIHIPVTESTNSGRGTNLLKFTEYNKNLYIDPYEAMMTNLERKEQESREADLTVNVRVSASQDIEAFVEIDKASGNVLSGRGNGVLDLAVTPEAFTINGDYTLTDGNYKFVALGLVSRDFQIQDGSSVRFNGELLESTLDINAVYKTKASLSTLIADSTSVANRRTVECGISITDKLSDPRLNFSIEIPDLDPTIKSRVESALSTDDKIQKQFLSLILSNSFLPDEQSGIVNNTSMLYSNVTEMLANQLSNIFQKLNIPLDLGLNYQPNEKGHDIFDVAVSTQLFNNRVVMNGSVGNKQYSTGGTQDVVGDLDIEIKLDRSGSFRLNLFSHSADSYTNFLDNSQRNGVGLTYQTEFNNFGQFIKSIFTSKGKRQAARQAEEQAIVDGGKVTLELGSAENN